MKYFSFLSHKIITLLIFIFSLSISAQTKIIKSGDEWLFYDSSNTAPENWQKPNETKNWNSGPTPLGYGDSAVLTTIHYGDNPEEKHISKYFKKVFTLDDPYKYLVYSLNVIRDDGVVIYLNGREIMRNNMPEGIITDDTKANSLIVNSEAEEYIHKKLLLPDDFLIGVNTLSVRVHKARKSSVDCIFDLELIGDNNANILPFLIKERSLKNLMIEGKLKDQNHKQELINNELKHSILEQKKENLKWMFYVAVFLLLISFTVIFYYYRVFNIKNKNLKNSLIHLKEQNMDKDRAMISSSINALNHQKFLKDVKKDLENSISKESTTLKSDVKKVINQLEYNTGENDDWENLKKHFEAVHSGFYEKLIKLHPQLSEVELRHCMFIKLHLQTKEIANILHISPKSVQASRYRIKKKMELNEETDLKTYLLKIK